MRGIFRVLTSFIHPETKSRVIKDAKTRYIPSNVDWWDFTSKAKEYYSSEEGEKRLQEHLDPIQLLTVLCPSAELREDSVDTEEGKTGPEETSAKFFKQNYLDPMVGCSDFKKVFRNVKIGHSSKKNKRPIAASSVEVKSFPPLEVDCGLRGPGGHFLTSGEFKACNVINAAKYGAYFAVCYCLHKIRQSLKKVEQINLDTRIELLPQIQTGEWIHMDVNAFAADKGEGVPPLPAQPPGKTACENIYHLLNQEYSYMVTMNHRYGFIMLHHYAWFLRRRDSGENEEILDVSSAFDMNQDGDVNIYFLLDYLSVLCKKDGSLPMKQFHEEQRKKRLAGLPPSKGTLPRYHKFS